MRSQKSFTLIELLIVTPKNPDTSGSGGRSTSSFSLPMSVAPEGSFTLIELLIVIGILAILVAAVVVVLNPAQLLAQARDSKRQQDLSALNQALNTVYALDQTISFGASSTVYTSLPDSSSTCGSWGLPSLPSGWSYHCSPTSTLQNTNGTGWIPVNFQSNGVVNLSSLPTDPINTSSTGLYYTYVTGGSFELSALMEATKDKGISSAAGLDGGRSWNSYEVGSNLTLTPIQLLDGHSQDPSLVGWWPLDEGTGTTAYDQSGNDNNGTWSGTAAGINGTFYATSTSGYVGYFNGSNNFVSIPTIGTFSKSGLLTIGAWINTSATDSGRHDICDISGNTGQFIPKIMQTSHVWYAQAGSAGVGGDSTADTAQLSALQWSFVVGVFGNNAETLYVNGIKKSSGAYSYSLSASSNAMGWTIGKYIENNVSYYYAYGTIKDVRVYNRALSASEIFALYNATK